MMRLIETLKSFGLSEYEAKVILTLISKGELTAKEIAEYSNIPRTSVYDVVASLLNKGLVESYGKPLKFKALRVKDIIAVLEKKVENGLNLLKKELPSIESSVEVEEVKIYRGELLLSKLSEFIKNSKKKIVAILSHIPNELKEEFEKAKCELIVAASNASVVKNAKTYEFPEKHAESCHGLIVFDDSIVMMLFMNGVCLGIVGDGEGFVSLYVTLVNLFLEKANLIENM